MTTCGLLTSGSEPPSRPRSLPRVDTPASPTRRSMSSGRRTRNTRSPIASAAPAPSVNAAQAAPGAQLSQLRALESRVISPYHDRSHAKPMVYASGRLQMARPPLELSTAGDPPDGVKPDLTD